MCFDFLSHGTFLKRLGGMGYRTPSRGNEFEGPVKKKWSSAFTFVHYTGGRGGGFAGGADQTGRSDWSLFFQVGDAAPWERCATHPTPVGVIWPSVFIYIYFFNFACLFLDFAFDFV